MPKNYINVLIIGYGSIGKRHEEVLSSFKTVHSIGIVSRQNLNKKIVYKSLYSIENIDYYDYFIIASETNKHYEQLVFLEKSIKNKIIFCEKPLFSNSKHLDIYNNKVYVGYVLRFHPLLMKLKDLVKDEKIININAKCGQYLPSWRPNSDYRKSYSASKEQGGGVLLDLSHELDYVQWFVGKIKDIKSYQVKVSDLEIDSDDLSTLIGRTEDEGIVNISIDYISKITHRSLHIDTIESSYYLNFMANSLIEQKKVGEKNIYIDDSLERNDMFINMHKSVLNKEDILTSYVEAKEVMETIITIQENNK